MAAGIYDLRFIMSVTDRTGNTMRRVASDMRATGAEAKRMQKAFTAMDVGRGLQLRGLLAGAGLGVAAQQAANFETSVTKAATQAANSRSIQDIGKNTIALQSEILDLMGQFPASAQEQADAAYDIYSAMNVPLEKGVGLLKLFNMVAVAGATDLATATNAMITIMNNFGGTFDQNMKVVKTSFGVIRFGKLEFAEFNDMLNSVVPAAKGAGQGFDDVAGAMAFLTTRFKPNIAATGLSRLLEVVSRPDFRKGARLLGLEIEDASKRLKPFPEIISELTRLPIAKGGDLGQLIPMVTAIGRGGDSRGIQSTIQARRALIALIKDEQGYQKIQRLTLGATQEFEKRYTAMIGSAGVKWERFKASLQALLIMIGTAALPMFERLGTVVGNAVDWARANRGMIEFLVKATLAVAAASLLAGTFLKLYGASLIVWTGLTRLSGAVGGLLGFYARFAAASDKLVAMLGRTIAFMFAMGTTSGKAAGLLRTATTAVYLFSAALATLNVAGMKAALSLLPLMGLLSRLLKFSAAAIVINVVVNFMKKEKRDRAGFLAKRGLLGSAAFEMMFGTDFGTSKWFASEETKKAIDAFDKKQKQARQTGLGKVADGFGSDFKKLVAQIRKDLKSTGGNIFNAKMMKDLGLDPAKMQEQLEKLLNPELSGQGAQFDAKKQMAADIVQRTKELMKQASDGLMNVYNEFKTANESAFGSIFEPIEGEGEEAQLRKAWNWTGGANGLLNTMKARLAQFKQWRGSLNMLLKKGFSKDFVDEFKKMGPEGLKHIDELKRAGPRKVAEFNRVMAQGKGAIVKATEIDFKAQLEKWKAFGASTAFKIAAGLESAEPAVEARMVAVVQRLWGAVAAEVATQQVKLEAAAAAAGQVTPKKDISALTADKKEPVGGVAGGVKAVGINGKYAVPAAGNEGLSVPAVTALGGRGKAMGDFWSKQPPWVMGAPNSYTFNVDGTFLTPEEALRNGLNMAKNKTKNKR